MRKTFLLAGVTGFLISSNASAFDYQQYISGKLTYSDASHDISASSENMNFSDNLWGGSFAYGIRKGAIRTELEFNIKEDAEKRVDEIKNTVENKSVMLNAYYDIDTGTKITPYVGAGIGMSHLKSSLKTNSGEVHESENNFAWQVGAGVSYALTDKVALDAGYRYSDDGDVEIKSSDFSMKNEAKSHNFLLGLRYEF